MLAVTVTNNHVVSGYIQSAVGQQPEQGMLVRPIREVDKSNTRPQSPNENNKSPSASKAISGTSRAYSSELTSAEKQKILELVARDRQVRAHEQAHLSAAGGIARGGASFQYVRGPDGHLYAVGGEVSIGSAYVPGDPEATLRRANQIRAAALAPSQPSAHDVSVAAKAARTAARAQSELAEQSLEESTNSNNNDKVGVTKVYVENSVSGNEQRSPALNVYT